MRSLLTYSMCLIMLCLFIYFFNHLRITSILFDVNMYCRLFSISELVNWVISDPLVYKALKNGNVSLVIHMLVDFIMCLNLLRNRTHVFPMFTNPLRNICICINSEFEFWDPHKQFCYSNPSNMLVVVYL